MNSEMAYCNPGHKNEAWFSGVGKDPSPYPRTTNNVLVSKQHCTATGVRTTREGKGKRVEGDAKASRHNNLSKRMFPKLVNIATLKITWRSLVLLKKRMLLVIG